MALASNKDPTGIHRVYYTFNKMNITKIKMKIKMKIKIKMTEDYT